MDGVLLDSGCSVQFCGASVGGPDHGAHGKLFFSHKLKIFTVKLSVTSRLRVINSTSTDFSSYSCWQVQQQSGQPHTVADG